MQKKTYTLFEHLAAGAYYSDLKWNDVLDQWDSGFYYPESLPTYNFHKVWEELDLKIKDYYRSFTRESFYRDKELNQR